VGAGFSRRNPPEGGSHKPELTIDGARHETDHHRVRARGVRHHRRCAAKQDRCECGRSGLLGREGRRGVPGRPTGLVETMAVGGTRSRHRVRVVPFGVAVRAGAPGSSRGARYAWPFGERIEDRGRCGEAGSRVERHGAVVPRSNERSSQNSGITRHRVGDQRGRAGATRRSDRRVE
jgi:hypothetical protein